MKGNKNFPGFMVSRFVEIVEPLLLASRNPNKTREFAEILGFGFAVRDLSGEPEVPAVEETGRTFAENAILKAVAISQRFPGPVVGDDSGLEVDVLGGAPGVFSARYAGEGATDQKNIERLLSELRPFRDGTPLRARFRCVLALADEGKVVETCEGIVEGTIVDSPRGSGGFGYDPLFQPTGFSETFGELSVGTKNQISHRAEAIRQLRERLKALSYFGGGGGAAGPGGATVPGAP
jgi:XTP/dITP diphosphohydrolase